MRQRSHATAIQPVSLALVLSALLLVTGCRGASTFCAADLPPDWQPAEVTSASVLDLSEMARQATSTDRIYPGDVLEVTIGTGMEEETPQTWPLRVTDEGQINVPLVGMTRVAGLSLTEAEQQVQQVSVARQIYRDPHVSVLMKHRRMIRVRVVGAVKTPGVYELPAAGSDLLAALVAAGGLSEKAGTLVEIRHPNSPQALSDADSVQGVMLASFVETPETPRRMVRVDLTAEPTAAAELDLHLEDGSVVVVREKNKQSISVIGLVQRPDNYDLPTDESVRLLDAIALAGGVRVSVANDVRVIRRVEGQDDPVVIAVSLRKAKHDGRENLILGAGDIISVEETPTTFVVETIRGFLRFGFTSAIPGL